MHERDIFLAAIAIADPDARAAYVQRACGNDGRLRSQVDELLKSHEQASQFLETPAAGIPSPSGGTTPIDSLDTGRDRSAQRAAGESEFCRYLEPGRRPRSLGRLKHYEIEAIIGRGAFGTVAKAFDEKLHRVVAIKLMNPELAISSPPRKRFLREARAAAAVTHENIVAIYAVEEEPIPHLVMEYIPGETLQQRMNQRGPLDLSETLRIGQQIAAGLAAAHAVNLIHRDIKPSNILLTGGPNDRVKISDFGLARAVDDASLTSSGIIAGTPMYMSPEQARGESLDHRSDLFSLGSVLYEMVGGRPPFRAAGTLAVLKRVCDDTPRPLKEVIPTSPAWLEAVISRLLEKHRDDRYQSAKEVEDSLAKCAKELAANGFVVDLPVPAKRYAARSGRSKERRGRTKRRRRNLWPHGAAVMLLALLPVAVLLVNRRPTPETAVSAVDDPSENRIAADEASEHRPLPNAVVTAAGVDGALNEPEPERSSPSADDSLRTPDNSLPLPMPVAMDGPVAPLTEPETPPERNADESMPDREVETAGVDAAPEPTNEKETESEAETTPDAEDDAEEWIDLFDGRTLTGWNSTDTNPRAWRVQDQSIVVQGPGRGYLFCDFRYADFEVSLEYRTHEKTDRGYCMRAPDIQLSQAKALELTVIDNDSLPHTKLQQDGGLHEMPVHLDEKAFPPGEWNTLRMKAQGPHHEIWFNGELISKGTASMMLRFVPHHTALTRTAGRVALQHWGPERIEFRNIRVRELPPVDPTVRTTPEDTPRPRGFGGRGFGGGSSKP